MNRADAPRGDIIARQCAPVGDSEDDEEWSNDLLLPQLITILRISARQGGVKAARTCVSARIGKKISATRLFTLHGPINNRKLTAYGTEDSISIVMHNLVALAETPMAFWMFLLCRTSLMTIIAVRRTLSEREIRKYG
jgi:hypothetical protein